MFFLLGGITHLIVADEFLLLLVEDGVFHHHAPFKILQCQLGIALPLRQIGAFKRLLKQLVEMVFVRHGYRLGEVAFLQVNTGLQESLTVFYSDAQGLVHQLSTFVVALDDMIGLRQGHQPVDDLMRGVLVFP